MVERDYNLSNVSQTPNAGEVSVAVRLWGISFIVERETAQIAG